MSIWSPMSLHSCKVSCCIWCFDLVTVQSEAQEARKEEEKQEDKTGKEKQTSDGPEASLFFFSLFSEKC